MDDIVKACGSCAHIKCVHQSDVHVEYDCGLGLGVTTQSVNNSHEDAAKAKAACPKWELSDWRWGW